jgi:geranylgeranyl diphosphate synthase type II
LARAVEVVHAASLIVDDLPAMDDAALRRGVAATHHAFGEATTILASIALIAEAFEVIAGADIDAAARAQAAVALGRAIGPDGMAGGQERDVAGTARTEADVALVHAMKTGALFAAAVEIGTVAAGIEGPRRWLMSDFGMLVGKAFQEFDDLIDAFGTAEQSGKDVGQDGGKVTFVSLQGSVAAERHALGHVQLALECLAASGAREDELEAFVLSLVATMRSRYRIPRPVTRLQRGAC